MFRKVIKTVSVVFSTLFIIFGIYGGVRELTAEKTDQSGLVLSVVFITSGVFLLYTGIRKKRKRLPRGLDQADVIQGKTESSADLKMEVLPENTIMVENNIVSEQSGHKLVKTSATAWQWTALIVSAWVELVFFALGIVFALVFGVAGFKAGEMGAMVGILMVMAVIGITIIVSVRIVALWGLVKRKSWAPVLNLILIAAATVLLLVSGAWPVVLYTVFAGWCSVFLIRHKSA